MESPYRKAPDVAAAVPSLRRSVVTVYVRQVFICFDGTDAPLPVWCRLGFLTWEKVPRPHVIELKTHGGYRCELVPSDSNGCDVRGEASLCNPFRLTRPTRINHIEYKGEVPLSELAVSHCVKEFDPSVVWYVPVDVRIAIPCAWARFDVNPSGISAKLTSPSGMRLVQNVSTLFETVLGVLW